jgi:3-dehydrosphinganine reductase
MTPLQGKTILVTGASSGIGEALSNLLVARGANVLGVTRRPSALSPEISPILADLTRREEISADGFPVVPVEFGSRKRRAGQGDQ